MKTIIAGSRNLDRAEYVQEAVQECGWQVIHIVSGCARGIDQQGEEYARLNNIPFSQYPPYWNLHGNSAGVIRNQRMAENAEALIAIWDGESRGTKHMIDTARKRGLQVYIKQIGETK